MTIHIWKCSKCEKEIIYTSKQKHPSFYHKCKNIKNIKYFKYMTQKDFDAMHSVLKDIDFDPELKEHQYNYWKKRVNGRINELLPLIEELKLKGVSLFELSPDLYDEWFDLQNSKLFFNF